MLLIVVSVLCYMAMVWLLRRKKSRSRTAECEDLKTEAKTNDSSTRTNGAQHKKTCDAPILEAFSLDATTRAASQVASALEASTQSPLEVVPELRNLLVDYRDVRLEGCRPSNGRSLTALGRHKVSGQLTPLKLAPLAWAEREASAFLRLQRLRPRVEAALRESRATSSLCASSAVMQESRLESRAPQQRCSAGTRAGELWGYISHERGLGDLSDGLSYDARREVASSCCQCVAWLHACGLAWGDCRPENFLRFSGGSCKRYHFCASGFSEAALLQDCGVARTVLEDDDMPWGEEHRESTEASKEGTETQISSVASSEDVSLPRYFSSTDTLLPPSFCAPERLAARLNGQAIQATDSMDIWSLGSVLFLVLTGRHFLPADDPEKCLKVLLSVDKRGCYVPNSNLPKYVIQELDAAAQDLPLRARLELRRLLHIVPCCRPLAAEVLEGEFFGIEGAMWYPRPARQIFPGPDELFLSRLEGRPPLPELIVVEVTPQNFYDQAVTLVLNCGGEEYRLCTYDWRIWLRAGVQVLRTGSIGFVLTSGDLSNMNIVPQTAASWANYLDAAQRLWHPPDQALLQIFKVALKLETSEEAVIARNASGDHMFETPESTFGMEALYETWRGPDETELDFAKFCDQPILLADLLCLLKTSLEESGFFRRFTYSQLPDGSCAWTPRQCDKLATQAPCKAVRITMSKKAREEKKHGRWLVVL